MITFARDGTKAVCKITIAIPFYEERFFSLEFDCGKEYVAGLAAGAMERAFGDAMRLAREEAYMQGWRDAKSKKRGKADWWDSSL